MTPEEELQARFPRMTPVNKAPSMHLINGIGTRVYGDRDRDTETGTYVTTLCFCVLFIPILCIRAYRVAKSQRGWYFLGTEPLSLLAKTWNATLLVAVLVAVSAVGLNAYTGTPAYKAQHKMQQAAALAEKGQLAQAAALYQQLASARALQADNATTALKNLIDTKCQSAPPAEAAGVFAAAAKLSAHPNAYTSSELTAKGLAMANDRAATDPKGAIALLEVLRPLAIDSREIDKARLPLLEKWVAAEPANADAAIALAELLDDQNETERAKKLLVPFKDKIAAGEGARILGSIYVHDGNFEDAYALLAPYVKPRLEKFHAAEQRVDSVADSLWRNEVELLKNDKAPPDFYRRYDAATKDQQGVMVRDYISARLKDDPTLLESREALEKESRIVPVTLELGIAMLQRGQAQPNPELRKKQLEEAQEMFLSIQSAAGASDQYRIFLGQVYYWLGKHDEGRKLFDEFLASKSRSTLALLQISHTLRNVGADPEARALAEEAFTKAGNPEDRYNAAWSRAHLPKDSDDEIEWLRKSNAEDSSVKAALAAALGEKAFSDGRDAEAVTQMHLAIDAYNALPRSEITLNQIGLASYTLFRATGDPKDLERCLDSIQQAVNLDPSDSILLYNAGSVSLEVSLLDILGKDIDLRTLHESGRTDLFRYLYHDDASWKVFQKRVSEHPGIQRGLAFLDKVMVIAPKSARSYSWVLNIQSFTENVPALRTIEERIRAADVDVSDELKASRDFLAGTDDAKTATSRAAALKRLDTAAEALKAKGGVSYAVALSQRADMLMGITLMGGNADLNEVVNLATQARQLANSAATSRLLTAAHFVRAYADLRKSDAEFNTFAAPCERSLGPTYTLAAAIHRNDGLAKRVLANADVQQGIALSKEDDALFPRSGSCLDWAIYQTSDPAYAQRIADRIKASPRVTINIHVDSLLNPGSGSSAMDAIWLAEILNTPADAAATRTHMQALGIPVP